MVGVSVVSINARDKYFHPIRLFWGRIKISIYCAICVRFYFLACFIAVKSSIGHIRLPILPAQLNRNILINLTLQMTRLFHELFGNHTKILFICGHSFVRASKNSFFSFSLSCYLFPICSVSFNAQLLALYYVCCVYVCVFDVIYNMLCLVVFAFYFNSPLLRNPFN